jgi:hypothetical protein
MIPNFKEILDELSYRVEGGIPDLNKESHVNHLIDILRENGISDAAHLAQKARVYFSFINEDDIIKNKKSGNVYVVKQMDPNYHVKPTPAEIQKAKQKNGGKLPTQEPTAKPVKGASVFGKGKGADVFSKEKSSTYKASEEQNQSIDSINDRVTLQTKQHYKNGFIKGAAPGNAGSMLNENGSNDVAQYCMESGNTDVGRACVYLYSQLKGGKLLQANSEGSAAAGISVKTLRELREKNPELKTLNDAALSRVLIAASSGVIKANDSKKAIEANGWKEEDCVMHGFFGDKTGLEAQLEFVRKSNRILGPDGTEIPKNIALDLIANSGKAANPSDTAQFTYNSKTGETIIQFSSDKDSFDAIVAQSSFAKEGEIKKSHIDKLISEGKINQKGGAALKDLIDKQTEKLNKIESGLRNVASIPAEAMLKLDSKKVGSVLKTISGGADPMKYYNKIVPKYGKTEKEAISNFLNKAKDTPEKLSKDEGEIVSRLKKSFGLDELVAKKIDDIRRKSVDVERQMLDEMNRVKVSLKDGSKVGLGNYMDALNFIDKFHMGGAMGDKHGVFAYPGLFKVVCGFGVINDDIISGCMNTKDMDTFIKKFGSEKEELQRSKTNSITGSVRVAYFLNDKGQRVRIGEKRQRSKTGEMGRFNTVYKWDKDTIGCFKRKNGLA